MSQGKTHYYQGEDKDRNISLSKIISEALKRLGIEEGSKEAEIDMSFIFSGFTFRIEDAFGVVKMIELEEILKTNDTITHLGFSNTLSIEEAKIIARVLKVNTILTHIDLRASRIGDEGAKAIAKALEVNQAVVYINLVGNQIGEEGANAIAETLKINKTIAYVDLASNEITDQGVKVIAEALRVNKTVTHINFAGNPISDEGTKSIAETLQANRVVTHIDLDSTQINDILNRNKVLIKDLADFLFKSDFSVDALKNAGKDKIAKYIYNLKFYQVADKELLQKNMLELVQQERTQTLIEHNVDQILEKAESFINYNFFLLNVIYKIPENTGDPVVSAISNKEIQAHIAYFLGSRNLWELYHINQDPQNDNMPYESLSLGSAESQKHYDYDGIG